MDDVYRVAGSRHRGPPSPELASLERMIADARKALDDSGRKALHRALLPYDGAVLDEATVAEMTALVAKHVPPETPVSG